MKSPRFTARSIGLRAIFQPSSIEKIWKEKVRLEMRDQFISDPIEHMDFHFSISSESKKLSTSVMSGEYKPGAAPRILVEKSKGLCRQMVIPSVRDALILQCLSDALEPALKFAAPTSKSFYKSKDQNMSRAGSGGYGAFAAWMNFQREIFRFSRVRRYVVVTDIANYYDSIPYTHLRNIIASHGHIDEAVLDLLIYLLSELLWQPDYMPRIEVGLPQINMDAPRLLAHSFLYEIDKHLSNSFGGDFARFMDDIDIGVDTLVEAKTVLKEIDLILQTRQVRLNSGKTRILTRSEAITHFRIEENAQLNLAEIWFQSKLRAGLPLVSETRWLSNRIRVGLQRKAFDAGNGEKILRRLIGMATRYGAAVDAKTIASILKNRPASRDKILSHVAQQSLTPSRAKALSEAMASGLMVDHLGPIEAVNYLVETKVERRSGVSAKIISIINYLDDQDYFGFYAKVWLQSKYDTPANLLRTLESAFDRWAPDYRSGRLVGGMFPIFRNTAEWSRFEAIIGRSRNTGAAETYRFHLNLGKSPEMLREAKKMLLSPNPSRATGITHAKYLVLLTALASTVATPREITNLKARNASAWGDVYYRDIARRSTGIVIP